jgi:hypothetical protein
MVTVAKCLNGLSVSCMERVACDTWSNRGRSVGSNHSLRMLRYGSGHLRKEIQEIFHRIYPILDETEYMYRLRCRRYFK